jgi:hypothetical protein
MSDAETIIRYDGPALAGHEIDVQELAPALLALADMVQLTNRRFNGESSSMKVTVRADVKQQCFMLKIHLVQSILESARHLFGTEEYKTAKEIAEALDLIFPAGVGGGVFALWRRYTNGKSKLPLSQLETQQRGGTTIIANFYGDGAKLEVPTEIYNLAVDPELIALGKRVMAPLERPGYETLSFESDGKPVVEFDKNEARQFRSIPAPEKPAEPIAEDDAIPTPIRGRVSISTRRDEGRAAWGLKWAGRVESAHMPEDWLQEYQAGRVDLPVGSWLDVTIEMTTSRANPNAPATFKVLQVHEVIPPGPIQQGSMFNDEAS